MEGNSILTNENQLLIKCYYCSDVFSSEQLQHHITKCCDVSVSQQRREKYEKTFASSVDKTCGCCRSSFTDIESQVQVLQLRVDDEKRNRLQFEYTWLTELSKLHECYQQSENWRTSVFSMLLAAQKGLINEKETRSKDIELIRCRFDEIASSLNTFQSYIDDIKVLMEEMGIHCSSRNEELTERFDHFRLQQDNRVASLHSLNTGLERLQIDQVNKSKSMLNLLDLNKTIIENQEECSKQIKDCNNDLGQVKEFLKLDNPVINVMQSEQTNRLKQVKKDVTKIEDHVNELLSWQKFVRKKLLKLEKPLRSESTDLLLNDIYNSPDNIPPTYFNGRLLWCVDDFEEQFEESKHINVMLQSPVFYTHEFGYKLQMRLYPNGLGHWKGRHMIISLHVLLSGWNNLLKWPVKLNITVSIRDQSIDNAQKNDLIKYFGGHQVNNENEMTKALQMFIPHRTMRNNKHIYNNSVILEAIVKVVTN